ncbi:MAG: polymerase-binding protein, partial [Actinomycetota bacterium]
MSQSTMRGMRLGANSLESEVNVRFEARTKQAYECALGHRSELNFAADAE